MNLFKKTYWLIYPALIVIFMFTFDLVLTTENFTLKVFFCGALAFVLSPRKKIINTQKGKVKQITWIFLKKPIILNS